MSFWKVFSVSGWVKHIGFLFCALSIAACKHEPVKSVTGDSGFPGPVAKIMETRCATAGCHNAASYQNAGSLLLTSWSSLFQGASNGAAIIPFSPEYSPLLYFINTHADLGLMASPTMPYASTPLSKEDYLLIRDWVAAGAPDKNGRIPFASNTDTRQKIYMTMQGCDLLASVDAESGMIMRYLQLGKTAAVEAPHCVRVSNDGRYAYVSFTGGQYLQKIDTRTDSIAGEALLGPGSWNLLYISEDGAEVMVTNFSPTGPEPTLAIVKTSDMSVEQIYFNSSQMSNPHGITAMPDFNTFFITRQEGNIVYKLNRTTGTIKTISIDNLPPSNLPSRDPHEIMMTPDYSKYFLTCERSGEIRIMDAISDTLIKAIAVGKKPQEIALSKQTKQMLITCMEDDSPNPGSKGSVYLINYETFETRRLDGAFYQPHGIAADDSKGQFYVLSRNYTSNGPAPHHPSNCGGRNGFYQIFDLLTLEKRPGTFEVPNDPYSADVRFK